MIFSPAVHYPAALKTDFCRHETAPPKKITVAGQFHRSFLNSHAKINMELK
jgi:hypothetical protein